MPKIPELNLEHAISATSYLVGEKDGSAVRFLATVFNSAQWHTGTTAPDISTGTENDFHLNTVTGDIYQKTSGAWVFLLTIKGTDGADGADGADGVGIPSGGVYGQALIKQSGTDYDTAWGDAGSSGGVSMGKVLALS